MKLVSTILYRSNELGPTIHVLRLFLHTVCASGFRYGIYTSDCPPQEKKQDEEEPQIKLP